MSRGRAGAWLVLLLAAGCATVGRPLAEGEALRLSQLQGAGDPTRRASLRLCMDGLDSDVVGRPEAALGLYERAIQIDPTNPYAYLVLARHALEAGRPESALEYLNQAQMLLESEGVFSPQVEAHLAGLRGGALRATGRGGDGDLARARWLAPSVWEDGMLSASELR